MIIGISGKKGSGKDTFAEFLKKYLNNFTMHAFADPIKEGLCAMLQIDEYELYDLKSKENKTFCGKTYRELLTTLGTGWGREMISPDIWIKITEYLINSYAKSSDDKNVIITDVRFKNECKWIEDQGGVVIRIVSKNAIPSDHISETELDDYPFQMYVTNNGSLEELEEKAKLAADFIKDAMS